MQCRVIIPGDEVLLPGSAAGDRRTVHEAIEYEDRIEVKLVNHRGEGLPLDTLIIYKR